MANAYYKVTYRTDTARKVSIFLTDTAVNYPVVGGRAVLSITGRRVSKTGDFFGRNINTDYIDVIVDPLAVEEVVFDYKYCELVLA